MAYPLGAHTPYSGTRVKEEALPRLLNLLSPVVHSWGLFARQIGVPSVHISQIQAANPPVNATSLYRSLTHALDWWIVNHPNPTYELIISALDPNLGQATPVMNRALAREVRVFMAKERAAVFIAEGNQPKKGNCAAAALWTNFTALYDALAQPPVATGLAAKLCKGAIITSETRDVIQTPGMSPAEQTSLLLQAVESSIQIDYTMFRKFIRLLKKLPVLEPIAKQLHHCYSALVSKARLTESSSSGSDTDSTAQHLSQGKVLSLNDVNVIRKEIHAIRGKWQDIALELEMPLKDVDIIASDVKDDKERLLKVLKWWLTREQPKPTWSVLIESLRSCTIEENTLADELLRKYCPQVAVSQEEMTATTHLPSTTVQQSFHTTSLEDVSEVKQRIAELKQMYEDLVSQTQAVVVQQSPEVEDFRQKITLLPNSVKEECQKYLKELLPDIYHSESIEEIFLNLNFLWNYLSFGLLKHIIQMYGGDKLKQQIEEYSTAVDAFRMETSLHVFLSVQPKHQYREVPTGLKRHLKEMIILFEHENFTMNSSLSEVELHRQQLSCEFSLPDFAIILKEIKQGSLSTVWLVPVSVAATIKENLQSKHLDFLQEHEIIQLTMDGEKIFPFATTDIKISDLEFEKKVGEGGTGIVYKGHWKPRGLDVAIKTAGELKKTEVEYMNSLDHPNIISFYGAVMKMPNYYIVTEFAEHGSLHDYLHEMKFQVDYKQRLKWAMQIAKGMNYLHKMKIMHRDLKPHNILITKDLTAKICDFGAAMTFDRTTAHTIIGTFRWMAPEVLNEEPYSAQCDVYSFGMILYELLFCTEPFSDIPAMEAVAKIRNGEKPDIPDYCEPFLSTLLTKCWEKDPKARPSFASILSLLDSKGFSEVSVVFLQSLQRIIDSMDGTFNATDKIKSCLSSLTLQLQNKKLIPLVDSAAYQEAHSVPELMKSMSPYWNSLSIELLEAVVKSSDSSAAASALHDFKSARDSSSHLILVAQAATPSGEQEALNFLDRRSAHSDELQFCQPAVFARLAGHQSCAAVNVVHISVEIDQAILQLADYDHVTEAVADFLELPVVALVYCGCSENPLALFWELSKELVGYVSFVAPSNKHYRLLLQYNITTIVVTDEIKYSCPSMKVLQLWEAASAGDADKIFDLLKCVPADVVDFAGWTALVEASRNGHSQGVEILITEGANVNHQTKSGASPLFMAAEQGHVDVAKLLISSGADLNLQAEAGATPLYIAAQRGHANVAKLLIDNGADVNLHIESGCTPVYTASSNGYIPVVELLLTNGANVNHQEKTGATPLYIAGQKDHVDVAKLLINSGADLNLQTKVGATPLHIAAECGHADMAKLLINSGADLNLQAESGATPLFISSQEGKNKVVEVLLGQGANVNLPMKTGATPLFIAAQHGDTDVTKLLINSGADLNLEKENGGTPLVIASWHGHRETVEVLIRSGADINTLQQSGWTPLICAAIKGHEKVVELLLTLGANPNIRDKSGWTPLICAAIKGHEKVVELLLTLGANPNILDKDQETAVMKAAREGHIGVVARLIQHGANTKIKNKRRETALYIATRAGHTKVCEELLKYF